MSILDGMKGESQDSSHDQWIDVSSPQPGESATPVEPTPPEPSGSGGGGAINPATMVVAGMMIFAIAVVAVLANRNKGDNATPDEIVLEPEVVIINKGSAILTASYSTEDADYFEAYGEDEIQLTIVKNPDRENYYDVDGSTKSVQNVITYGYDRGVACPLNITHTMEYIVSGHLDPTNCRFFITVTLKPEQSELVQNACSFDPPGGVGHFYVAPRTDEIQFITQLEKVKSESFTLYLTDVKLPQGVNCPSFVR